MARYRVKAEIRLSAESEREALELAAAAIQYYDLEQGETRAHGVGGAIGSVLVEQD